MHILAIEDNLDLGELLKFNLIQAGYDCQVIAHGLQAWEWLQNNNSDLVLLDLMLPGMDGLELCRKIKQARPGLPIIMLTAKAEDIDKVVGLELGADDYITKPFNIRELLLRIKAVLRRYNHEQADNKSLNFGCLRIDTDSHKVLVRNQETLLTATEFELLLFLAQRPGRVLNRDYLLEQVWGYTYSGYARTIDTHMRRLRQKLEPYHNCLETVRGVGYRFNPEVCFLPGQPHK